MRGEVQSLLAAATGASPMYMLDLERGRFRCAAENRTKWSYDWPSDEVLVARVSTLLGHLIRHPHPVLRVDAHLNEHGWIYPGGTHAVRKT
jgi:hypothetical protein